MNKIINKKKIISILIAVVLLAVSIAITYFIQQSRYEVLQTQLTAFEKENIINKDVLTDILCRIDYKDKPVYVIGHTTSDSDTVCSAIWMAYVNE